MVRLRDYSGRPEGKVIDDFNSKMVRLRVPQCLKPRAFFGISIPKWYD